MALLASAAPPAGAELVVFSSGHILRTESFEVVGDKARLELPSQGTVWVSMAAIERVVATEVDLTPAERLLPVLGPAAGAEAGAGADSGADGESIVLETAREPLDPDELDRARSISGRVLDEAGEPLEGIELTARPSRLFDGARPPPTGRPEIATRSASDGSYRFAQLAHGEYSIRTLPTDRYTAAQTVTRTGVDFVNLVVSEERPLVIYGQVTSHRGEPLGAVRVTPVSHRSAATSTDGWGEYQLEIPVTAQVRIQTLEFELEEHRRRVLRIGEREIFGRREIRLDTTLERLAALAPVEGKVSDRDGTPLAGETVRLVGDSRYQAVTDEAGTFAMPEVETGATYQLRISPRGPYKPYRESVRVGAEGLQVSVVVESEPLEYASLSGRILDVGGDPVPHFSLWLRSGNRSARQPILVTSDAAGRFSVDRVPAGRVSFTSQANPQFTVSGLDLSAGEAESVNLVLDLGGYEVRGRVVDGYGSPVAAPRVTLHWSHQGNGLQSRSLRRTSADGNGFFTFTDVGPGTHLVSVAAPGFHNVNLQGDSPGDLVVELRAHDQEGESPSR